MKIKNGEQCIVQYRGPPPFVLPVCNFYNMGPHAGKKVGPAPLCGTSKNIHVYVEIHIYVYIYIYIHMYTYTHVCVLSRIRFSADTERGIWLCVSVRCESQGRGSPEGCDPQGRFRPDVYFTTSRESVAQLVRARDC